MLTRLLTYPYTFVAELPIPIGIPTKEAKTKIETHPVIVEITIREGSILNFMIIQVPIKALTQKFQ